jgi:hypothetical protein
MYGLSLRGGHKEAARASAWLAQAQLGTILSAACIVEATYFRNEPSIESHTGLRQFANVEKITRAWIFNESRPTLLINVPVFLY